MSEGIRSWLSMRERAAQKGIDYEALKQADEKLRELFDQVTDRFLEYERGFPYKEALLGKVSYMGTKVTRRDRPSMEKAEEGRKAGPQEHIPGDGPSTGLGYPVRKGSVDKLASLFVDYVERFYNAQT
ncbi:hypothetical protein H6758_01020 [Candidatus Nomurabacteria bacterium]|nr:hypothetical protein [Candidatus Nomurabacteria bacterium]